MHADDAFGIAGDTFPLWIQRANTLSLHFPKAELYFITELEAKAASCPRTPY